jgi:hypothetical protein
MERLIRAKTMAYLDKNNLISNSQAGFRVGHSTVSQLLKAQDKLLKYTCGTKDSV